MCLAFNISNSRYQEEISSEQWTVRSAVPGRGLGSMTLGGVNLELQVKLTSSSSDKFRAKGKERKWPSTHV